MVSEQVIYKGNGQRRGEEGTLDQSEVHDKEKSKIQTYTRVTIPRMTGKKIFQNTDQNTKSEHGGKLGNGLEGSNVHILK